MSLGENKPVPDDHRDGIAPARAPKLYVLMSPMAKHGDQPGIYPKLPYTRSVTSFRSLWSRLSYILAVNGFRTDPHGKELTDYTRANPSRQMRRAAATMQLLTESSSNGPVCNTVHPL